MGGAFRTPQPQKTKITVQSCSLFLCHFVVTRVLQLKVVVCFLILGAGRAVNVLVPYTYKIIGEFHKNFIAQPCTV